MSWTGDRLSYEGFPSVCELLALALLSFCSATFRSPAAEESFSSFLIILTQGFTQSSLVSSLACQTAYLHTNQAYKQESTRLQSSVYRSIIMPLAHHEVQSALGTTCKNDASFYVCYEHDTKFLGCCTIDPCKTDDGLCPDDDLEYSSYDTHSHNSIGKQECQSDRPDVQWWTCGALETPFMGCCSTNPCAEDDGCPEDEIFPARLSDDPELAKAFLSEDEQKELNGDDGLSKGAIGGIAAGATIGGLLIIGAIVWFFLRRRKQKKLAAAPAASVYEPYANQPGTAPHSEAATSPQMQKTDTGFPPYSPYPSSYAPTPNPQSPPYQWQGSPPPGAPSPWQPTPEQGHATNYRDSVQTAHTGFTGQTFASELPATAEYTPQGHTHAAEMDSTPSVPTDTKR